MKRFILLIFTWLLFIAPAFCQDTISLHSPYDAVRTHLHFLQDSNYHPDKAARCFNTGDNAKNRKLAIHLKQVLDAKGLIVNMDELPQENNYKDTVSQKHKYTLFPEEAPKIYLTRKGDRWYYSKETTEVVPRLHNEVFPFGSDLLVNIFPAFSQQKFLGLKLWQYLGLLILLTLSLLLFFGLLYLLTFIVHRYSHLFETKRQHELLRTIIKPLSGFFVIFLVQFLIPILQLPIKLNHYLVVCLDILQPVLAILFFFRSIDILDIYLNRLALKTESTLDDQLMPLVRKTLKVLIVIVGGLFILQNLNFNITTLLAGISIGGLAFALAAQDTLRNFFGSLMIFIDRPFQIGDWIHFDGTDGTVEEVGFRSTRVRTFANSLVSIPNGSIANMKIDNLGLRQYRRFYTEIALPFHTPPHLIETYIEGLREWVRNHPNTRKDFFEIHLNSMSDHSLNIIFYIFFTVPTWSDELQVRHDTLMTISKMAEELGVQFAYPTHSQQVETFPGSQQVRPGYEQDPEKAKEKVAAFLKGRKGE